MLGDEWFPLRTAYKETHNAPSVRTTYTRKGHRRNVYVKPLVPSYVRDLSKRKLNEAGLVKDVLNRSTRGKNPVRRKPIVGATKKTFGV